MYPVKNRSFAKRTTNTQNRQLYLNQKKMRKCHLLLSIILISVFQLQAQKRIFIKGANLIQVEPFKVLENHDVLIEGSLISKISSSSPIEMSDSVTVIHAKGKYLMPGLVDSHVHMDQWATGATFSDSLVYILNGVTTVLNLRGNQEVLDLRDFLKQTEDKGLHPNLYTSGRFINQPYFYSPEEVEAEVIDQYNSGYDIIKMHGDLSLEAFNKLHETANKLGIKVIGHAPRNLGMDPVFDKKQALAHAEEYMYASFSKSNTPLWQNLTLTGLAICVIMLLITIGLLIALFISFVKRNKTTDLKKLLKLYPLATLVSLLIFFSYFLSVPPFFPFFLNSIFTKILIIVGIAIQAWFAIKFFKGRSKVKKVTQFTSYFGSILLGTFILVAIYWLSQTFKVSENSIENIVEKTAKSGIVVCPNIIAYKTIADSHYPTRLQAFGQSKYMNLLTARNRAGFLNRNDPMAGIKAAIAPGFENQVGLMKKLVGMLFEKGVPLLAGTDSGIYWVFPGVSLHQELELLVESGVTPIGALQAATINVAKLLEKENEFGDIQEGLRADLVLLNKNPLQDIKNTSGIEGVFVRGNWIEKSKISSMKDDIATERRDL